MATSISYPKTDLTYAPLATRITRALLDGRRKWLHAKTPRSRYVRDVRVGISCGRSRPVEKLLAVSLADVQDGVPLAVATKPYQDIIDALTATSAAREARPLAALPLLVSETRAQAALDEAQLRLAASPTDAAAMDEVLARDAEYRAAEDRYATAVRLQRAALQLAGAE